MTHADALNSSIGASKPIKPWQGRLVIIVWRMMMLKLEDKESITDQFKVEPAVFFEDARYLCIVLDDEAEYKRLRGLYEPREQPPVISIWVYITNIQRLLDKVWKLPPDCRKGLTTPPLQLPLPN